MVEVSKSHSAGREMPPKSLVEHDLKSNRNEYVFKPPKFVEMWLTSHLENERDAPMTYLLFNILIVSVPTLLFLFALKDPPHWLGLLYFTLNAGLFLQRFILCLHYMEHLQPFKPTLSGRLLFNLFTYFFCAIFGIPPGVYKLHHLVMHHCENNLFPWDLSSTEPYKRDNFPQFLWYWLRFLFAISVELPWYAVRRGRYFLAVQSITLLSCYIGGSYFLYQIRPVATLWGIMIPCVVASFAMMFGNWSQHIFIDPSKPRNNYSLTYNLINCSDNQKSFNDGYHIIHHTNSKVHWLDLPSKFLESLEKHANEDALTFEGISFFDVGLLVFTGQLGALATRYVDIGNKKRSKEEIVAILKRRLEPIKANDKSL